MLVSLVYHVCYYKPYFFTELSRSATSSPSTAENTPSTTQQQPTCPDGSTPDAIVVNVVVVVVVVVVDDDDDVYYDYIFTPNIKHTETVVIIHINIIVRKRKANYRVIRST